MPDDPLTPLAVMAMPGGLDALEADVLAAIEDQARARTSGRTVGAWSVAAALAVGLVGGGVAGSGAPAQAVTPIGIDGALAPSTLLLGR